MRLFLLGAINCMEPTDQKMRIWRKHPLLTVLGALVINLCIYFPCSYAVWRIMDYSELVAHLFTCGSIALVFSLFLSAVYLTGWGADSTFERICVIIGTSLILMIVWFIGVLILIVLGVRISSILNSL